MAMRGSRLAWTIVLFAASLPAVAAVKTVSDPFSRDKMGLKGAGTAACDDVNDWKDLKAGAKLAVGDFNGDDLHDMAFSALNAPGSAGTGCPPISVVVQSASGSFSLKPIFWPTKAPKDMQWGYSLYAGGLLGDVTSPDELVLSIPLFGDDAPFGTVYILETEDWLETSCTLPPDASKPQAGDCPVIQLYGLYDNFGFGGIDVVANDNGPYRLVVGDFQGAESFQIASLGPGAESEPVVYFEDHAVNALVGIDILSGSGATPDEILLGLYPEDLALCQFDSAGSVPDGNCTVIAEDSGPAIAVSRLSQVPAAAVQALMGIPTDDRVLLLSGQSTGLPKTVNYDPVGVSKPIGYGAAVLGFDLSEREGDKLVVVSAVDQNTTNPSAFSEVIVMRRSDRSALVLYTDSGYPTSSPTESTQLGSALASFPGVCQFELQDTAPGLLIGAPSAPAKGKPPVILVCPTDDIDQDNDGLSAAQDCNDHDSSVKQFTYYEDKDGDGYGNSAKPSVACASPFGYVAVGGDCDDNNAGVNPSVVEACNGLDDDCDGSVDEGLALSLYPDADKDGFGDEDGFPKLFCNPQSGYVADHTDCDDDSNTVYPGAPEKCDKLDNDCDDEVDEGVFVDQDGDGVLSEDCKGGTDCNDSDKTIYPGAVELCDRKDNDCNGTADDGDEDGDGTPNCAEVELCNGVDDNLNGDVDEGFDLDGDGFSACAGDCNDELPYIHPGAPDGTEGQEEDIGLDVSLFCDGLDNDCDGAKDEGDWDGDGRSDCYELQSNVPECALEVEYYPDAVEVCDGEDNNCSGEADEGFDLDGDGFVSCVLPEYEGLGWGFDCNDHNPQIYPGANEQCDLVDQDCDGSILDVPNSDNDEDGTLDCIDDDGDGVSELDSDCNDQNAYIAPGAPELVDGIDNNCNGIVDEDSAYYDDDGDGFTEGQGDCNDYNVHVFPGGVEVVDGLDNDCDGLVDEGTDVYDDDGDSYSEAMGDCDDSNINVSPSMAEECDGLDNNCDGLVDEGFDVDGDGFTTCGIEPRDCGSDSDETVEQAILCGFAGADCNDLNAAVHPFAVETCNGVDDDCDGISDYDSDLFDEDSDGTLDCMDDDGDNHCEYPCSDINSDGICDEGLMCAPRSDGTRPLPGDCDDQRIDVKPGAPELAGDGIDSDCDSMELCFVDNDADGYAPGMEGTPSMRTSVDLMCSEDGAGRLASNVASELDCNDDDINSHPGASEICGGSDNNCDGFVDEAVGVCYSCSYVPSTYSPGLSSIFGILLAILRCWKPRRRLARGPSVNALAVVVICAFPWSASAAQDCRDIAGKRWLESTVQAAETELLNANYGQSLAVATEGLNSVSCLTELVDARYVARLSFLAGLAEWYQNQSNQKARQRFRDALVIDLSLPWDDRQVLALRNVFMDEARKVQALPKVVLKRAWSGQASVWIDSLQVGSSISVVPGTHFLQMRTAGGDVCTQLLVVPGVKGKEDQRLLIINPDSSSTCRLRADIRQPKEPWPKYRYALIASGALFTGSVVSGALLQRDYNVLKSMDAAGQRCADSPINSQLCDDYRKAFVRSWVLVGSTAVLGSITYGLFRYESKNMSVDAVFGPSLLHAQMNLRF